MKRFSETEQKEFNSMPVLELDKQIISGERKPVYVNDGRIAGEED